jgi:prophage antirepressor-like protein
LGFYVKSERAKLFRDWVERLVVNFIEKKLPELPETPKRKHNRLTPERMIAIMSKLCQVKDDALRIELAELITGHES